MNIRFMKRPLLHPFLFAAYQIVFLYVHNMDEVPIGNTFRSFSVTLLAVLILTLFLKGVIRRKYRPEIITTLFIFLFFSYDYLVLFVDNLELFGDHPRIWHQYALIVFAVLTCALAAVGLKIPEKHLAKITGLFNIAAFCLLCFQILIALQFSLLPKRLSSMPGEGKVKEKSTAAYRPDVYYIVLDAYARQDVLKEIYGYDNSPFIDFLENRGFYVAHKGRANYDYTNHSIASQLNMSYLHDMTGLPGPRARSETPLIDAMMNSEVRRQFEKRGYKYIFNEQDLWKYMALLNIKSSSGYFNLFTSRDNPFERFVIYKTPMQVYDLLTKKDNYKERRKEIKYRLEYISSLSKDPAPTFLHTHVVCPHYPYVFDENGKSFNPSRTALGRPPTTLDRVENYRRGYVPQLKFVSSVMERIIDEILAQSSEKPIIILQSDHGPSSLSYFARKGAKQTEYLYERLSNLLAFYFPDENYEDLYEEMTPINSFRIILNRYFDQDYALLQDRLFHTDTDEPYDFIDVTDKYNG